MVLTLCVSLGFLYSVYAFIGQFFSLYHTVLICVSISAFLIISREVNGFDKLSEDVGKSGNLLKRVPSLECSRFYNWFHTFSTVFSCFMFSSMVSPAVMGADCALCWENNIKQPGRKKTLRSCESWKPLKSLCEFNVSKPALQR